MSDLVSLETNDATMTSREIAELCEKRHDHVVRDIEKMFKDIGLVAGSKFGPAKFEAVYSDAQGKPRREYHLPKDLTVTLITGYRADLRYKVVKRLEELEAQDAKVPPLNDPNWLRGTLITYTEKVIALETKIKEDKPKTEFFDKYCNSEGLYGLQNAGRALGCKPNLFIRWLKADFLFYQGTNLVPRVRFIQQGVFEVKSAIVDDKARPQTYVTTKGMEYLEARVPKNVRLAVAS